jgi:type IV secretion system protein VirD4
LSFDIGRDFQRWVSTQETPQPPTDVAREQTALLERMTAEQYGIYVGRDLPPSEHWVHAKPESGVLVLGPPRSGKSSAMIVPNVLSWPGSVVSTSVKSDVLQATANARANLGDCWLFDPSGTTVLPAEGDLRYARVALPSIKTLNWSPVTGCARWSTANRMAERMIAAAGVAQGLNEESFWSERAAALLGPLLHAAAIEDLPARRLAEWIRRRDAFTAQDILRDHSDDPGTSIAIDTLQGLLSSNERELMSHWSTVGGAFAAYRTPEALATTDDVTFDPVAFARSSDTVYITAAGSVQDSVAPLIVAFLEQIRDAVFSENMMHRPPMLWALDEMANIAPLPELPSIVSQAGGQGLQVLACLQDLSQARKLWKEEADGFLSLFHGKVVFGGIGDTVTLERLSTLVGEREVEKITGSQSTGQFGVSESRQRSTEKERILPVSMIANLPDMLGLAFKGVEFTSVRLVPYFKWSPLREIAGGAQYEADLQTEVAAIYGRAEVLLSSAVGAVTDEAGLGHEARPILWRTFMEGAANTERLAAATGQESAAARREAKALRRAGLLDSAPDMNPKGYVLSHECITQLCNRLGVAPSTEYYVRDAPVRDWLFAAAIDRAIAGAQASPHAERAKAIAIARAKALPRTLSTSPEQSQQSPQRPADTFSAYWRSLPPSDRWAVRLAILTRYVPARRRELVAAYVQDRLSRWPRQFKIGLIVALVVGVAGSVQQPGYIISPILLWVIAALVYRRILNLVSRKVAAAMPAPEPFQLYSRSAPGSDER